MKNTKYYTDFTESINQLKDLVPLYYCGKRHHVRGIATQLWLLLGDTRQRKKPLISQVIPDMKFHAIQGTDPINKNGPIDKIREILGDDAIFAPVFITGNGNKVVNTRIRFDEHIVLDLDSWLDQPLFNQEITIRKLIQQVRHKIGAHSDEKYGDVLDKTQVFRVGGVVESQEIPIVAIAEYLLKQIELQYRP